MLVAVWEQRVEGPLTFHFQPDSYVQDKLDAIVADYQMALREVTQFLGIAERDVPALSIYLCPFVPSDEAPADPFQSKRDPEAGEVWSVVHSESSGADPAGEIAQIMLHRLYGPATPATQFWYDGLAGYLAKQCGSVHHGEVPARIQKLFEAGQLPPLVDLLALYTVRRSATGSSTATVFVDHLVQRHGAERFRRMLNELHSGDVQRAARRAYGVSLQTLEQSWYRGLERAAASSTSGMLDTIKQMLPYVKRYRKQMLGILFCILVAIAFAIFMPLAIRFLVNNILARAPLPFAVPLIGEGGERIASGDGQMHALWALLGTMVFMFILSALSTMLRANLTASMGEAVNFDLRMRAYQQLQRLTIDYHRKTPNPDISQRFWVDVSMVTQALTAGIIPMTQAALSVAIFATVLVSLNWKLSLVALLGMPIFWLSFRTMRARIQEAVRERLRRTNDVSQLLSDTLIGQEKVKLLRVGEYLTKRLLDRLQVLRDTVTRITLLASTSNSTGTLITNGAQVAILIIGGWIVIGSGGTELTTGDLMAFYVLLLQLYAPAAIFTSAMQFVNQATTSIDRVNGLLAEQPEAEVEGAATAAPLAESIRLESLSYGRTKGKDLIKDLTLEIKAGTRVAFVGPPGAGKASLMELLPRFFDVDGGAILWDGVNITQLQLDSLRRQLAVVSQETFVFRTTVYDNIRYGRVEATDEAVIWAAQQAGLHDFVLALPGGYDTQINDRDTALGLVQRQRLSVARALLQDASVILIDDALSALDAPSQRALEEALRGPNRDKTFIRVAQRLGSVQDADCIFVMDSGELVQQGTHEELISMGGLYTQLLKDELGAGAVSGAFQAARRLARQEPFKRLPPEAVEEMAQLMLYTERSPGDIVCRQGSVGDELFFLGRGEVEIVIEDEGQERIVNTLHDGEYFGEISFILRIPRTATVRARTHVELHILRRQDFDTWLEHRGLDEIIEHLQQTADERLAANRALTPPPS